VPKTIPALRHQVAARAGYNCEYCQMPERACFAQHPHRIKERLVRLGWIWARDTPAD
jgi:hypothetical protein